MIVNIIDVSVILMASSTIMKIIVLPVTIDVEDVQILVLLMNMVIILKIAQNVILVLEMVEN